MIYTGSRPINLSFDAIQALSIKYLGIFFIGYDMKLHIFNRLRNLPALTLDMGDDVVEKDVYEFTVVASSFYSDFEVIIRNSQGVARYVTIHKTNQLPTYGDILTGVMKVAGGQILYADAGKYVVENGKYLQLGEGNTLDIIPNGTGGVKTITLDNVDANIKSVVGSYTLYQSNDLHYNGSKIASDIISVYNTNFAPIEGLSVGRIYQDGFATNDDADVRIAAHNKFIEAGVEQEWHTAYEEYMDAQSHPSCDWVGSGLSTSKPIGYYDFRCITQQPTRSIGFHTLATGGNGDTYKIVRKTLTKIEVPYPDADGFNALYGNKSKEPILFDKLIGNSYGKKFWFEEPEMRELYRSDIILRR